MDLSETIEKEIEELKTCHESIVKACDAEELLSRHKQFIEIDKKLEKHIDAFQKPLKEEDFVKLDIFSYEDEAGQFFTIDETARRNIFNVLTSYGAQIKGNQQKLIELLKVLMENSIRIAIAVSEHTKKLVGLFELTQFVAKGSQTSVVNEFGKMQIGENLQVFLISHLQRFLIYNAQMDKVALGMAYEGLPDSCIAGEFVDMWDNSLKLIGIDSITDRYCAVGEIMKILQILPMNIKVWEYKGRKDKYDAVKGWLKAYKKKQELELQKN